MDLGLFYQIQVPKPWDAASESRKFHEMMEQVSYAEAMGMTSVWFVEHHFRSEWSHSSAPDITLAALSQRTATMRLGNRRCAGAAAPSPQCGVPDGNAGCDFRRAR